EIADFERVHWLEGDALGAACGRRGAEVGGFLRHAELSGFVRATADLGGVVPVPLLSAAAIPGGPLSVHALATLKERIVASLRGAGALDGLFLSLHGAMRADGCVDPETELLRAVRAVVGDIPIAASFDLHGHLTADKVGLLDVIAAYRTNPHRDHFRVGRRAGRILIRTVRGEVRPTTSWRALPMVLGGGTTLDFLAP